ncbi:MAG: hypothetical protein PHX21_04960 [bacterium]|nr:hypothetical protein [bacterium]
MKKIILIAILTFVTFGALIYYLSLKERNVIGVDYMNVTGRIISGQVRNFGETNTEDVKITVWIKDKERKTHIVEIPINKEIEVGKSTFFTQTLDFEPAQNIESKKLVYPFSLLVLQWVVTGGFKGDNLQGLEKKK